MTWFCPTVHPSANEGELEEALGQEETEEAESNKDVKLDQATLQNYVKLFETAVISHTHPEQARQFRQLFRTVNGFLYASTKLLACMKPREEHPHMLVIVKALFDVIAQEGLQPARLFLRRLTFQRFLTPEGSLMEICALLDYVDEDVAFVGGMLVDSVTRPSRNSDWWKDFVKSELKV